MKCWFPETVVFGDLIIERGVTLELDILQALNWERCGFCIVVDNRLSDDWTHYTVDYDADKYDENGRINEG